MAVLGTSGSSDVTSIKAVHSDPGLWAHCNSQAKTHCKIHGERKVPTKQLLKNNGCCGPCLDSPTVYLRSTKLGCPFPG